MKPGDDPRFTSNRGYCPEEARGKRVEVLLSSGQIGKSDIGTTSPPGWAADGKGGCNWARHDSPFAITKYRVL